MTGDAYTIATGYKIFVGDAAGEPMDEPSELHLYAWLRTRRYSEEQAVQIIQEVKEKGSVRITLP